MVTDVEIRLNVSKCKVLTISNKTDPDKFNYTLNNDPLEHANSHQYLGITINSNLRWNTHASDITATATRTLNVIRRTLHPCNPEVKKVAYVSLVRPKLEYASASWNPHTQNDTTRLEKVQRNAARFILSDYEWKSSVTDMLYKLNLDTLERRGQHHDEDLPQSILWSCWHQHSCLDYPVPERQLKMCATSFSHQLSSLQLLPPCY